MTGEQQRGDREQRAVGEGANPGGVCEAELS